MLEVNSRKPEQADLADRISQKAAIGLTRRSVICRAGYAAAALLGAKFLVADGPRALAKVAANPPPNCFDQAHPCAPDGLYCGIGLGVAPCSQMAGCKGCLQANGCPVGTAEIHTWQACCLCTGQANHGTMVNYSDCCGLPLSGYSFNNLPAPCNGCFPNGLTGATCVGGIHGTASWCSYLQPDYICTNVWLGGPCNQAAAVCVQSG